MKHLTIFISAVYFFVSNVSGQISYGEKRVLFSKENHAQLNISNDTSLLRFTPAFTDIDLANAFVIKNFNPDNNFSGKTYLFEDYYRQYFGILKDGRRCLFIRGFCKNEDCFLQPNCDFMGGGTCFFKILVDIDHKTILTSRFNAPK